METALTFEDVLLKPRKSNVLPRDAVLSTRLTKSIMLNIPILSSAMDTVTESKLAIAIALEGGLGIIHKNMEAGQQAEEVRKVKKFSSWIINDPITLTPKDTIRTALKLREKYNISGFPVVEGNTLVGIITRRDMRFKKDYSLEVREVMTRNPVTADENISMDEAFRILDKYKIEKLPIVDEKKNLKGLITVKDIEKTELFPNSCRDEKGRLRVGAAIGPFGYKRAAECIDAGADVIIVDTAHGHSMNVINAIKKLKSEHSVEIIAGNIATAEAAEDLIQAGADALKVGIGPGSICTTRIISGVGVPQITAIMDVAKVANRFNIPVIADGGIRYSGDIAKAIAAGAGSVMIGNLLAGTEESPGRIVFMGGRKYKQYRGMGSIGAMKLGSMDRYGQHDTEHKKLVAEGVEGIVPYKGNVSEVITQLIGGLRSAMGYCGSVNIKELQDSTFIRITGGGLKESHPHNIHITEEAPNYR